MTHKILITVLVGWAVSFSTVAAFSRDLELIWPEPEEGGTVICYSRYRDNKWSSKRILAAANGLNVTPAVASSGGKNLAIWVHAAEQGKLSLSYSTGNNGNWGSPQELPYDFQETTAPALVFFDGRFYLFFAGNHNDDDDIYMAFFDDNTWSDPVMIHPDNNVPDILPEPQIVDNTLAVRWQHFDGDRYIYQNQKLFDSGDISAFQPARWHRFQKVKAQNVPGDKPPKHTRDILKEKFAVNLPKDFRGIGLARAYIPDDDEMPALHINATPY
ncbi:MAG: sialidase family protein [Desulforhopalus sp.]